MLVPVVVIDNRTDHCELDATIATEERAVNGQGIKLPSAESIAGGNMGNLTGRKWTLHY